MQFLPAIRWAVIRGDSQFEPFRKRLGLPHYGAGGGHQDEAMGVSGVVIEPGDIRQSQRLSGISIVARKRTERLPDSFGHSRVSPDGGMYLFERPAPYGKRGHGKKNK